MIHSDFFFMAVALQTSITNKDITVSLLEDTIHSCSGKTRCSYGQLIISFLDTKRKTWSPTNQFIVKTTYFHANFIFTILFPQINTNKYVVF